MLNIPVKTRLTQKGQVTIPKEVRDYLGLKNRNRVEFKIDKGKVFIQLAVPLEYNLGRIKPKKQPENFKTIRQEVFKKMAKEIAKE